MEEHCCICGTALPNRYALAGTCEGDGCAVPFCRFCWGRGNHRCRACGHEERAPGPTAAPANPASEAVASTITEANPKPKSWIARIIQRFTMAKSRKRMNAALDAIKRMGSGAAGLLARLNHAQTPEEMAAELDHAIQDNEKRRLGAQETHSQLYDTICRKKADFQAAPAARRNVLQSELKTLLQRYKAAEREITILLENIETLTLVKGKLLEKTAYDLRSIDEDAIDDLAIDLEDRAAEADAILDARNDLERAGARQERAGQEDDFLAALEGFGEPLADGGAGEELDLEGFEAPPPAEPANPEDPEDPDKSIESEL